MKGLEPLTRVEPTSSTFVVYASKYASLNLAHAGILTLGGGTVVVDASLPVTADLVMDPLVNLRFEGQGMLTGAAIVTVPGLFEAPPRQVVGSGITISLAGNSVISQVYAEWWGASPTATATVNTAAINAANAALVSMNTVGARGSGVIQFGGSGQYDINGLITLGDDSVLYTSISLQGVGGIVGTTLNWTGSTSGTAIYVTYARGFRMSGISLVNGVAIGTTTGLLLSGPGAGTGMATTGVILSEGHCRGFGTNVQVGQISGPATDTVTLIHFYIDNTTVAGTGIAVFGGNSLAVQLVNSSIVSMDFGVDIVLGGEVHVQAGLLGRGGIAIRNQGGAPMAISGVRFELHPTDIAVQVTNPAPMQIEACSFAATSTVLASPVLTGKGQWTLQNNRFGSGNDTGWKTIEIDTSIPATALLASSLVMINNRIFGDDPFYVDPGDSTSNNLTFNLFGNERWAASIFAARFPDEVGQVVWPDRVSFKPLSSGYAASQYSPAQITANQNNYLPLNPNTGLGINAPRYLHLTTDASREITGLTFLTPQADGQTVTIINAGTQDIVLKHISGSSSAANRFVNSVGGDITLTPAQAADLIYDGTAGYLYWRVFKRN